MPGLFEKEARKNYRTGQIDTMHLAISMIRKMLSGSLSLALAKTDILTALQDQLVKLYCYREKGL